MGSGCWVYDGEVGVRGAGVGMGRLGSECYDRRGLGSGEVGVGMLGSGRLGSRGLESGGWDRGGWGRVVGVGGLGLGSGRLRSRGLESGGLGSSGWGRRFGVGEVGTMLLSMCHVLLASRLE